MKNTNHQWLGRKCLPVFRGNQRRSPTRRPPREGGGNGRVTETRTITKTVTLTETDTETQLGPWLCGRTLFSQEGGGIRLETSSLWGLSTWCNGVGANQKADKITLVTLTEPGQWIECAFASCWWYEAFFRLYVSILARYFKHRLSRLL